jgi:hypothetical protein
MILPKLIVDVAVQCVPAIDAAILVEVWFGACMEPAIAPVRPTKAVDDVLWSLIRRLDVFCDHCIAVLRMKVIQIGPIPEICYDSTEIIGQTFVRVHDAFIRPCSNHRRHTVRISRASRSLACSASWTRNCSSTSTPSRYQQTSPLSSWNEGSALRCCHLYVPSWTRNRHVSAPG